jgi:hypothetical protein
LQRSLRVGLARDLEGHPEPPVLTVLAALLSSRGRKTAAAKPAAISKPETGRVGTKPLLELSWLS